VQYPAGRSAWLAGVLALWSLAGLLALAAWARWGASAQPSWVVAAALLLWLSASVAAGRFWARLPQGMLAWDGQVWELRCERAEAVRGTLTVHLDLQQRIGVRLEPEELPPQWLLLERHHAPARWGDVRRAVYSRAGAGIADAVSHDQSDAGKA